MAISPRRRALSLAAAAALLATLTTVTLSSAPTVADPGPAYSATITRTEHGIPHIQAGDFGSLGFGSGYATAQTDICTLADVVLTARGERSRYLGPDGKYDDLVGGMSGTNLQVDALVTDLHNRKVVEGLLASTSAGPGAEARAMVTGYAAGVNKYLAEIGGSAGITDPQCRNAAWIQPNATPMDVWYGVYLANIIGSTGHFLQQIVGATPPSLKDPGLPSLATFGIVPPELPTSEELTARLTGDSEFGSNATAIGGDDSTTGRGMLLGNPHFPWNGRYRFTQQQLTIPGQYDVAGASLIGSPVVNIGWNKNVAWSHTVSTAYRFTPYEYRTVLSPFLYLSSNGLLKKVEKRVVEVTVKKTDGTLGTVTEDMYRTPQGYVIDDPSTLMGWTPLSFFAIRDANGEQLRTIDTFLNMGKATNVHDLLARQDAGGGMPWVNTTAADRTGEVLYADHSVVPNVSDKLAGLCMTPIGRVTNLLAGLPGLDGTFADNLCKWGTDADAQRPGIFGTANLPATFRRDWVMNANDSYWLPNPAQELEGYDRIIGCENCVRTLRTRMVDRYVMDALAQGKISPDQLAGFEHQNRVLGAEVMSENGDLVKICQNADGGDACPVLAAWDKHSNVDSVGNHIFEEFVKRLPKKGLLGQGKYWEVGFDRNDPVNTPRNIDEDNKHVVAAMRDAIAFLRSQGVPMDATWGSLQVSGDRGAPAIPLGGGLGDQAGNANALATKGVVANGGFFRPVTYGSSHIQAIAFTDTGVDARTILTYGQSDDPTSPWSSDQTALFGAKQWVSFPFTPAQIAGQQISSVTVTG
ncbi:MAG: penicillin acylase family protein [Nocardioidaceae bacterium]|nr:penicillin acylase family protein [Nocardioidaceae bacterium]